VDGKVSPVVVHQAEVTYLGFTCHGESDSDQLSSSDEHNFIIGVTGGNDRNETPLFRPYQDVDAGESHTEASARAVLGRDFQPHPVP